MSRDLTDGVRQWSRDFLKPLDKRKDMKRAIWGVKHGDKPTPGLAHYQVTVEMPPDFEPMHVLKRYTPEAKKQTTELQKAFDLIKAKYDDCNEGRWITVHPHGDDEHGQAVYICPNPDGSHTITRGAGGSLNGLRLTGVKSEDEYKQLASKRREEKRLSQRMAQQEQQKQMGAAAYAENQQAKIAAVTEAKGIQAGAERDFISAVLTAQGIDPAKHLDIGDAAGAEGADARTKERLQAKHHQRLLTYARRVAESVKEIVSTGLDGVSAENCADMDIGDIAKEAFTGQGKGYSSPVKALASEYGFNESDAQADSAGVRFRSLIERSGNDLGEAVRRREAAAGRTAARRKSDEKVKEAAGKLGESGMGPEAVSRFATAPNIESMDEAVNILKAAKAAALAKQGANQYAEMVQGASDLSSLPKASVVVSREVTPEQTKQAIADTLSEESMQRAMLGLVNTSNDLEKFHGSLKEHYSVGQNLGFNSFLSGVNGTSVDPLVHDILGAAGAASIIVRGLQNTLGPEEFARARDTALAGHLRMQEGLVQSHTQAAEEYLNRADELSASAPKPETPESVAAALEVHAEAVGLINKAREEAGVARGRMEAGAALNEAFAKQGKSDDKRLQVSLGSMPPAKAMEALSALGLTDPTKYDPDTGKTTSDGDYALHTDGKNTIASIESSGLSRLAAPVDPALVERCTKSAAIKTGADDEEGWLPKGITRRPMTEYREDSLERNQTKHLIGVASGDSAGDMATKIRRHIGALMHEGRDAEDAAAQVQSEEFVGGLALSPVAQSRYLGVLSDESPRYTPKMVASGDAAAARDELDSYNAFQNERQGRFQGYLDDYLASERAAGRIGADQEALDKQRLPVSDVTQDAAYVSALADPRTRFSFHKYGELGDDGRAAIRAYAFEKVFGLDPKNKDDIISTLDDRQKRAYSEWQNISQTQGDPYTAIQKQWAADSTKSVDLFGDAPKAHTLSTVDLTDDSAVTNAAREFPKMLGYAAVRGANGEESYPDLDPASKYFSDGQTYIERQDSGRTEQSVASDARGRIKKAIREYFTGTMLGDSDLASEGFNPEGVKTASNRWAEYAREMGDKRAYQTVQDYMKGDLVERFSKEYQKRTGLSLDSGIRSVSNAESHATASLSPDQRRGMAGLDASGRANLIKRDRGRFVKTGTIKDRAELDKQMQAESAKLVHVGKEKLNVNVMRQTIGDTAERTLAQMMPYIDTNRPVTAAGNVSMSGKDAPRQRAIKLILANKRQGCNLGTGGGKTIVALGAFTHALAEGKVKRGLFVVPSNIVGQFSQEIHAFRDPATPLRWTGTDGLDAKGRHAALSNDGLHIVLTTPEAMREDVTHAVAEHMGVSKDEAAAHLLGDQPENERHALIHAAMTAKGYNFDYVLNDEGHRLLSRQGKPDALMQRVGDGVGARASHYVYSTADPVKNDASEAWSVLHKIDPERYDESSRNTFMRKYGRNTLGAGLALQRTMEPYLYAENIDIGVDPDHAATSVELTPEQQKAYSGVTDAYNAARRAKLRGQVDMNALMALSPKTFKRGAEAGMSQEEVAANLNKSLATVKDGALGRIVNAFPGGAKEQEVFRYLEQEAGGEPTVVFAHHVDTVNSLAASLKAKGYRVGSITGEMSTEAKDKARLAFSPPSGAGEASTDVLICSDAAAMGGNYQRGKHLINVDVPHTAMIHRQRMGRILRPGQENTRAKGRTVPIRDLVANCEFDRRARRRLETKGKLRELLTSPYHSIDDTGLAEKIEQAQINKVEQKRAA